jgi:hypothetical protein
MRDLLADISWRPGGGMRAHHGLEVLGGRHPRRRTAESRMQGSGTRAGAGRGGLASRVSGRFS